MSTGNFHSINNRGIFALRCDNEFDYDDHISNIEYAFNNSPYSFWDDGNDPHELRSYSSKVIGRLNDGTEYLGVGVDVTAVLVVRSGYYEHCNADFHFHIEVDGIEVDTDVSVEDIYDQIEYRAGVSEKKARQFSKYMIAYINKKVEEMSDYIEEQLKGLSEPLRVAAKFSNGETMYEAV